MVTAPAKQPTTAIRHKFAITVTPKSTDEQSEPMFTEYASTFIAAMATVEKHLLRPGGFYSIQLSQDDIPSDKCQFPAAGETTFHGLLRSYYHGELISNSWGDNRAWPGDERFDSVGNRKKTAPVKRVSRG
jgi:hypothetical protein